MKTTARKTSPKKTAPKKASPKKTTARKAKKTSAKSAAPRAKVSLGKELVVRFKNKFKQEMQDGLAKKAGKSLGEKLTKTVSDALSSGPSKSKGELKPGAIAPAFNAASDTGKNISLSQFKGKKVVLYFYPKDDTPGCTQESCDFRDSMTRLQAAGAVVLGVSKDSVESHVKFKSKYSLPFPLLSDEDTSIAKAYGVWKLKSNYGREYMGMDRTTFLIDVGSNGKGKILKVYPKVQVKGHVDEVLSDLSRLKESA